MRPRELEASSDDDLKGFRSELAVKGRMARSTQKQALNALVFLFREAPGGEAGDLSGFQTSRRGPRIPTVLTLLELLRLRIKLKAWAPEDSQTRAVQELVLHRRAVVDERTALTNRLIVPGFSVRVSKTPSQPRRCVPSSARELNHLGIIHSRVNQPPHKGRKLPSGFK